MTTPTSHYGPQIKALLATMRGRVVDGFDPTVEAYKEESLYSDELLAGLRDKGELPFTVDDVVEVLSNQREALQTGANSLYDLEKEVETIADIAKEGVEDEAKRFKEGDVILWDTDIDDWRDGTFIMGYRLFAPIPETSTESLWNEWDAHIERMWEIRWEEMVEEAKDEGRELSVFDEDSEKAKYKAELEKERAGGHWPGTYHDWLVGELAPMGSRRKDEKIKHYLSEVLRFEWTLRDHLESTIRGWGLKEASVRFHAPESLAALAPSTEEWGGNARREAVWYLPYQNAPEWLEIPLRGHGEATNEQVEKAWSEMTTPATMLLEVSSHVVVIL